MDINTKIINTLIKTGLNPIPVNEANNLYLMIYKDANDYLLSIYLFINNETNRISFTCPLPHHVKESSFDKALAYANELNLTLAKGIFFLRYHTNEILYRISLCYSKSTLDSFLINNAFWACLKPVKRYHLGLKEYIQKDITLYEAKSVEYE